MNKKYRKGIKLIIIAVLVCITALAVFLASLISNKASANKGLEPPAAAKTFEKTEPKKESEKADEKSGEELKKDEKKEREELKKNEENLLFYLYEYLLVYLYKYTALIMSLLHYSIKKKPNELEAQRTLFL